MPGEVSKHYSGEAGREYFLSGQQDPSHRGYEIDASYFLPYLKNHYRILDFGCGNGGMLRILKNSVAQAEGLEVNPSAAELARQANLTIFPNIESLPNERVYDAIVTNHVLEHVPDVPWTLEALRGRLKPGGIIVAKLPIDDIRSRWQRTFDTHDNDHHLHTWTPRLFANVLTDSGYTVRECRIITSAWHYRLFWLRRFGLERLGYWLLAIALSRRQLFAVGEAPC